MPLSGIQTCPSFERKFKNWIPTLAGMTVWFLAVGSPLYADAGRTAGSLLTRTFGARPAALGEAYAGAHGDINSIVMNPAGLATLPEPTLSAIFSRGFAD